MALTVNLDKMDKKALAALPPFIGAIEKGRTSVTLLFSEDAEYIAGLMKEAGLQKIRPDLCEANYWFEYDMKCAARISLEKVIRKVTAGKGKRNYLTKYKISKMITCPRGHKCTNPAHACRPINRRLAAGHFSCTCRPPSDQLGDFAWS